MTAHRAAVARRRGWVAFTVPPVVWMAQLLIMYLLVPFACDWGTRAPLLVITVITVAAALGAIAVGRRGATRDDVGGGIARVGRVQGWVFVFAILAAGAVGLWIDPCA